MKLYLHLAEGFEEIEAITVIDVLRRAGIDIETVSITGSKEVKGAHDIKVVSDKHFEEVDYNNCEMIIFPGGMPGTMNLESHKGLSKKVMEFQQEGKWIAAICAAPKILGNLELLVGKDATCYPGFEEELKGANISSDAVVQSDKIITSKGPGTAMLFALRIVEVLKGKEIAEDLKGKMIVL